MAKDDKEWPGLSDQQARFVRAYLIEPNATKAAIAAGYAKGSAAVQGSRLLRNANVAAILAGERKDLNIKARYSADDVIRELERIGFMDFRDLASWDSKGVSFKPSETISDDAAATLKGLESKRECKSGEWGESETITLKVHRWDKLTALKMLAEHHGILKRDDDPGKGKAGEPGGVIELPMMDAPPVPPPDKEDPPSE